MPCMLTLLTQVVSICNGFNAMWKQSIHSLHNIHICNGKHVNGVNTINYNVNPNTKSTNYMKI